MYCPSILGKIKEVVKYDILSWLKKFLLNFSIGKKNKISSDGISNKNILNINVSRATNTENVECFNNKNYTYISKKYLYILYTRVS